jgi:phosphoribosylanthranilate isomerase
MPKPAKICGVSTPEAVAAALQGGAAYLGFVFFPKSPRYIRPEPAARLAEPARGQAKVVALMVDPTDNEVDEVVATFAPDLIQLHGKESPTRVREIGGRSRGGIIKALSVSTAQDVAAGDAYAGIVEHLMFDAKAPEAAARPGGHGVAFDWTLLAGHKFPRPWFLAGGLDPWNVADAVRSSGAPMVDVSSGVERGPGLKDPALITAFLDAARRA